MIDNKNERKRTARLHKINMMLNNEGRFAYYQRQKDVEQYKW